MEAKDQLEIIKYLLYTVTSLITLCGCFVTYIFNRHTRDNDRKEEQNREDHQIIFEKIDSKVDKE